LYSCYSVPLFFVFNVSVTSAIYTLSLHDALPILKLRFLLPSTSRPLGSLIGSSMCSKLLTFYIDSRISRPSRAPNPAHSTCACSKGIQKQVHRCGLPPSDGFSSPADQRSGTWRSIGASWKKYLSWISGFVGRAS